jgi:hypothetical protein
MSMSTAAATPAVVAIKLAKVKIDKVEGKTSTEVLGPYEKPEDAALLWDRARSRLYRLATGVRPPPGGDKTDVTLTFEDGTEYTANLLLHHVDHSDMRERDIARHVFSFLAIHAGIMRPSHADDDDKWKSFMDYYRRTIDACRSFLTKYDLDGLNKPYIGLDLSAFPDPATIKAGETWKPKKPA